MPNFRVFGASLWRRELGDQCPVISGGAASNDQHTGTRCWMTEGTSCVLRPGLLLLADSF